MKNKLCYFIVILFGAIYAPISLVNHYMFRTYSLDLGLFNHALYSFAHLKMDNITLMWNANYLGDHFSPIMILLSPLYYFKSTYVLLIVQIAAILWGG
ncbi:MAG: DUF2079 domain-containing protein, partial [Bacteroidetes bacterium]|nr:DUF2079 domain-containing protein [Bacteroidota bacterium]